MADERTQAERQRLGQQLAETRKGAGLTVRELSAKSGVNYANITKIERGYYNASIDVMTKILAALDKKLTITDCDSKID